MRIISKNQDYYDSAIGYGIDKEVVYLRKPEEFYLNKRVSLFNREPLSLSNYSEEWKEKYGFIVLPEIDFHTINSLRDNATEGYLMFCGEIYPYIIYEHRERENGAMHYDNISTHIFYNKTDFENFLVQMSDDDLQDSIRYYSRSMKPDSYRTRSIKEVNKFFESFKFINKDKTIDFHMDLKTPIIKFENHCGKYRNSSTITVNPVLKDIQFYKVKDAFQTFQEISMFVSGVLPRQGKEMIELDDKIKRDKHGFDEKSFKHRK